MVVTGWMFCYLAFLLHTNLIHSSYSECMKSKSFNISLPKELVDLIDQRASREYTTRSEFIRRAAVYALEQSGAFDEPVANTGAVTLGDLRRENLRKFLYKNYKHRSAFKDDVD